MPDRCHVESRIGLPADPLLRAAVGFSQRFWEADTMADLRAGCGGDDAGSVRGGGCGVPLPRVWRGLGSMSGRLLMCLCREAACWWALPWLTFYGAIKLATPRSSRPASLATVFRRGPNLSWRTALSRQDLALHRGAAGPAWWSCVDRRCARIAVGAFRDSGGIVRFVKSACRDAIRITVTAMRSGPDAGVTCSRH